MERDRRLGDENKKKERALIPVGRTTPGDEEAQSHLKPLKLLLEANSMLDAVP